MGGNDKDQGGREDPEGENQEREEKKRGENKSS